MTARHAGPERAGLDLKRLAVLAALGIGAAVVGSIVLAFLVMMWAAVFTVVFT